MSKPIFWKKKKKKNIINMLSAEFTQRVTKIKYNIYEIWEMFYIL